MSFCESMVQADSPEPPFERIVIVEWYDGPVTGIATWRDSEFAFRMVAWDDTQRMRVYTLTAAPKGSLSRLVEIFAAAGQPRWPAWWPAHFASEVERERAWAEATSLLQSTAAVMYVIGTEDLSKSITYCVDTNHAEAATELESLTVADQRFEKWLAFLRAHSR